MSTIEEEEEVRLKGMTWDHPRGYDPLAAAAAAWEARTGVGVDWERRSLQDFETYSVRDLAEAYDLIVIDHPHVGQVTAEGSLRPFDPAAAAGIARGSLGGSFESYRWRGAQWALPIDAAAQVQAWRPDRLPAPAGSWAEIMDLAADGRIACPMRPPHSLMSLYTLCGMLGASPRVEERALFDPTRGAEAYGLLAELVARLAPDSFAQDPIAVLERMAQDDSPFVASPLIYGYVSYALAGFRPARIAFADLPTAGDAGPRGSALGGTGLAVSAFRPHADEATAFALWVAGAEVQAGLYAAAGGQPGHAAAWAADEVNRPVLDFYRATRRTLDGAWLRPRHDGYMEFQQAASDRLNAGLQRGERAEDAIAALNVLYEESL